MLFGYGHANNGKSTMFLYSAPSQQPCLCVIHERYKITDNHQMKQNAQTHTLSILLYPSTPENCVGPFSLTHLYVRLFAFSSYFLRVSGLPDGSDGKESAHNAGDPGSIPGPGRSPGEGYGNSLQIDCKNRL